MQLEGSDRQRCDEGQEHNLADGKGDGTCMKVSH